ncbi:MAG: hypothetical protein ACLP01_05235 [Solirubrobacteraceae bacterium]
MSFAPAFRASARHVAVVCCASTALLAGAACQAPAAGAASAPTRALAREVAQISSLTPAQITASEVCPPVRPGYATCQALVLRHRAGSALVRPAIRRGRIARVILARGDLATRTAASFGGPQAAEQPAQDPPAAGTPAWLQQAYDLTGLAATRGTGDTVAIIDASDDPAAEADLGVFRTTFGLPPCTTANGCFRKVNELGESSPLPASDPNGWNVEESLDLDAVSSLCPNCDILLVEASSAYDEDLLTAMQTAVDMGASQLSASWSDDEPSPPEERFTWPGVATLAATGDDGYIGSENDAYPAALAGVTAVGGTTLSPSSGLRGLVESAWSGAGSGCDLNIAKPSYQPSGGCAGRAYADVSADADPMSGLSIYDSGDGGWAVVGGTSLATPLVAAFEAIAGVEGASPQWAYSDSSLLNDPVGGSNASAEGGDCAPAIAYICTAGAGYDGPTGAGSISGLLSSGPPGIAAPGAGASGASYVQSVSGQTAQLLAGVYPNGLETTYWWQYGTGTSYGESTASFTIGASSGLSPATATITGLTPGSTYHFRLVAENSAGSIDGYDYTLQVPGVAPVSTSTPAINGKATVGAKLTASIGTWAGAAADTLQWQRCGGTISSCTDIPDASATTYTTTAADRALMLRLVVTALNPYGSASATSAPFGPVSAGASATGGDGSTGTGGGGSTGTGGGGSKSTAAAGHSGDVSGAPVDRVAPRITGAFRQGAVLTVSPGSWSPAKVRYHYRWMREGGGRYVTIAGASSRSYRLRSADAGRILMVRVTAVGSHGSAFAYTSAIGPILPRGVSLARRGSARSPREA